MEQKIMESIGVTWTQLAIVGGLIGFLLALIFNMIRSEIKSMKQVQKESDDEREELKKEYLTEEKHGLLCENSALRFEKKIDDLGEALTKTFTDLTSEIVKSINGGVRS